MWHGTRCPDGRINHIGSPAKRVSAQAKAQEGEGTVEEKEFVAKVIVPESGGDEGKEIAEDGGSEADDWYGT